VRIRKWKRNSTPEMEEKTKRTTKVWRRCSQQLFTLLFRNLLFLCGLASSLFPFPRPTSATTQPPPATLRPRPGLNPQMLQRLEEMLRVFVNLNRALILCEMQSDSETTKPCTRPKRKRNPFSVKKSKRTHSSSALLRRQDDPSSLLFPRSLLASF
jgi:hypothetical protein